ncbi:MAG: pyruvate, phosphate dikinase [Gammaproteobacteria bacterium RIFOXYA12_FULL_61_12]|nr:MAG: pyruvate, phosphate dikinase [Gammaproteobacteria bacterium RIFOXYA12_FULL_61_12]OGT88535.1 MAG: pyruvate, phosphate dikinase [Gammaproteobacteria bacterium RIFOXYD12_FULL_61_37]
MASQKRVHFFGKTKSEGTKEMKDLLGGKGANLAEMTSIGLPVPPGFTITTETCAEYNAIGGKLPDGLLDEVHRNMALLEAETGKKFGSDENPLLVSVRSGAAVSMPGMMDTVLNLGLTDKAMDGLANNAGNRRFALDAYRRLINMFGDVVMEVPHHHFEDEFDRIKAKYGVTEDTDLNEAGLQELIVAYKDIYKRHTGTEFPQDPYQQLEKSIEAVFKSWNIPRAVRYREINEITGLLGTAVNIQTMVFGNMGDDSGTGVAFTRDPSTGDNEFFGEFLVNAQGEDVVAGIRTPQNVDEMVKWRPDIYEQLLEVKRILENHYREMQDIEYTIEKGKLFLLQTRTGKRTGRAAVKIAVDMVVEGRITQNEALVRVPANDLNQLLLPTFSASAKRDVLTVGLPASPGAASGKIAFSADEAVDRTHEGESIILVRKETSPEDVSGMHAAAGILTSTGGMTSHAAVVARGWGKCCIAGAGEVEINEEKRTVTIKGRVFGDQDVISIDGSSGEVMAGEVQREEPKLSDEFMSLMEWADRIRTLKVWANADTPKDAERARGWGAQGIGLCRTEHMFFEGERITDMREMILAETEQDRKAGLDKLLPHQREDFKGLFSVMQGLPVTVRLLDPPLHEFLPHEEHLQQELAERLNVSLDKIKTRVSQLHETNPMLGHRGCRLSISYPEILSMQVTAITEAAIECRQNGIDAQPEIMVPLVGTYKELALLRKQIEATIQNVKAARGYTEALDIPIGTMIEIPRAALTADEVARHADFFSFGTNDLTQMTFGFSRDDINSFLPNYIRKEILERDPFQSLDTSGVGQLVSMAVAKGRGEKKGMKMGICGEHGGDPLSIRFCHRVGLSYVSCSPFRVPVARLAAAQAAVKEGA